MRTYINFSDPPLAIGIITANDRTLLAANGGHIKLGLKWCESLTTRLNFVKRKATTAKPLIAPGLIKEVGLSFYKEINEIVHAHKIPPEYIYLLGGVLRISLLKSNLIVVIFFFLI